MKWIKCSDRLPELKKHDILILPSDITNEVSEIVSIYFWSRHTSVTKCNAWRAARLAKTFDGFVYWWANGDLFDLKYVTHWMEIEAPNAYLQEPKDE